MHTYVEAWGTVSSIDLRDVFPRLIVLDIVSIPFWKKYGKITFIKQSGIFEYLFDNIKENYCVCVCMTREILSLQLYF